MKALVSLVAGLVIVLLSAGAIVYGSNNLNSPETKVAETATEQSGRDSLG